LYKRIFGVEKVNYPVGAKIDLEGFYFLRTLINSKASYCIVILLKHCQKTRIERITFERKGIIYLISRQNHI